MAARTTTFGNEPQIPDRVPASPEERQQILEQVGRIAASPLFKHSKHYPAFLRFVVERALDGQEARLKERTIGIEVFGRHRDYDTNLDPVVRTSACEVRKRLTQYYAEPGREGEVRIELHSGSYVPEFRFPAAPPPAALPEKISAATPARGAWLIPACCLGAALLLAVGAAAWRVDTTALEQFWAPVWGNSDILMISMGGLARVDPAEKAKPEPTVLDVMRNDRLAFADAVTMGRITGLLRASRKKYDIRHGEDFTLTELRKGPVVLIGAFNNDWTMRLEDSLRFVFEKQPGSPINYIRDRRKPTHLAWKSDPTVPYSQFTQDYAIVSRFVNPLTEKMTVVVAGMSKDGTMAAGEFVSEPQYMEELARRAPAGWQRMNLQVVIRTEVVKGSAGPPSIVDTSFW
jgi:hypothetical protein